MLTTTSVTAGVTSGCVSTRPDHTAALVPPATSSLPTAGRAKVSMLSHSDMKPLKCQGERALTLKLSDMKCQGERALTLISELMCFPFLLLIKTWL